MVRLIIILGLLIPIIGLSNDEIKRVEVKTNPQLESKQHERSIIPTDSNLVTIKMVANDNIPESPRMDPFSKLNELLLYVSIILPFLAAILGGLAAAWGGYHFENKKYSQVRSRVL